jgi:mono/diheme cytochrome c family protein
MHRVLKWSGIVVAGIAALALIALAAVYIASEYILDRTYQSAGTSFHAAATPAEIARGKRLVTLFRCQQCHDKDLSGGLLFDDLGAKVYSGNLPLFVRNASDADFDRALRHGLRTDGTSMVIMPAESYQYMRDDEAAALLSYLRSLKPHGSPQPAPELSLIVRSGLAAGIFKTTAQEIADVQPAIDLGSRYAPGRHLATLACGTCHTPSLSGRPEGPPFVTPDLVLVASYERADFFKFMRTGKAAGDRELPIMSATARSLFSHFTDEEVGEIYDYLVARGQKLTASPGK